MMKKKNKFIAKFMSCKHTSAYVYKSKVYKYNTSWNWLMPVVDKINTMYKTHELYIFSGLVEKIRECVADVDREAKYNLVIEFIKLYNNINEKQY